jgi:formamidopyrimidine-DNA glycosylase
MPELPDLEVFSRNLTRKLKGKVLKKIVVRNGKRIRVSTRRLKANLEGEKLVSVRREGKELRFAFSNDHILGLHLMLRGELFYFEGKNEHKYAILELHFDGGAGLAITDRQGMANPSLDPPPGKGMDALSKKLDAAWLGKQLSGAKATIKNLLMDQGIIRGIGNAYADEILWDARISPFSISSRLPAGKVKKLAASIKKVLKAAQKSITRKHPGIIGGEIRDFLEVHSAKKERTSTGALIRQKATGGRKTYYTDEQQLFT